MASLVKTTLALLSGTILLLSSHALALPDQNADKPYEDALASFYLSELNAAIIHLKNALKNDPEHLPSMVLLAEVYIAMGDGASAENQLENAQEKNADESKILPLMLEAYLLQQKYKKVINAPMASITQKQQLSKVAVLQGRAFIAMNNLAQAKVLFQEALEYMPSSIKAQLGIAQVELLNGNMLQARAYIDKALSSSPTNSIALTMLANIEQQAGNRIESLKIISQVIELNNKDFPALLTRASLYIELGDFQLALNDLGIIITEIPNEPKANYLKIIANSALGNTEEVNKTTAHINTVLMGLPEDIMKQNPVYLYLAGVISFQQQENLKAQDFLQKYIAIISDDIRALKLAAQIELALNNPFRAKTLLVKSKLVTPDDVETWSLLGQTYTVLGELQLAEDYLKDVIDSDKEDPQPLFELAKLEILTGKFPQAITHLQLAKSIDANISFIVLLAEAFQQNNQFEQALEQLDLALILQSDDSVLHLKKGILLGQLEQHLLAKESLEQSLKLNPNNLRTLVHLSRIDVIEQQPEKAITKINKKIVELTEPNSFLLIELGNIHRLTNNNNEALSAYKKAYSVDNTNPNALINIIEIQVMLGQLKEAITLTSEFLNKNNKAGSIYLALANLYMADKEYQKAFSTFELAVKNSNDKSNIYNIFADAQLSRSDFEGATLSLKRSISWNAENLDSHLKLFDIYLQQKNETLALDILKRIAKKSTNIIFLNNLEGNLYLQLGKLAEAEKIFLASLKKSQNRPAVYGLYRVYKQQEQFSKALDLLTLWVKENPRDITSQIAIADTLVAKNQLQSAAKKYQDLIEMFSELPILLNNAAQVFIKLEQFPQALTYAKKADKILPDNVAIMDTLAWSYTLNKQADLALPIFRQVIVKDFNNAEIKYHLAVTLYQLDRKGEAKKYLKAALENESTLPNRAAAIALMEKLTEE
ncbi:PEP-CTERM system TPR-repeat protein PrsT [Colwellia sp. BRX10-9]|uniref:XrtA/PEP-CTERM system TPR-repeat protein PrsT n=1 Tax=Colwellia sp. BRX10-9 TaxID=2759839 RepID=UPI0015F4469A|nr:XrtA/PEP-CTERM system TPR-repeat protein PrsT [Colwellia sp. BRX10-9]MBA6382675.1 PEP-CTERM system TPR-repeat protein PrsT [Colwellia sp. BRX10-9]